MVQLSSTALLRLFERYPKCYLGLAQLIVPRLSPLFLFTDLCLEWQHADAGSVVCREGLQADASFVIIHGRLRAIQSKRVLAEIGPGESFGEAELFQEQPWPANLIAIRDAEYVRVPKDVFDLLLRSNPGASLQIARLISSRLLSASTGRIAGIKTLTIVPSGFGSMPAAEALCRRLYGSISAKEACTILTKSAAISALGKHTFTAYGKLKLLEWLNKQEDLNNLVIYLVDTPSSPWTLRCLRQVLLHGPIFDIDLLGGLYLFGS
jgi:lysophospholipid hydrolase